MPFHQQGAAAFLLGMAAIHDAGSEQIRWNAEKTKRIYLLAARYLDQARYLGIPTGREQECRLALGKCLFQGERFDECRPVFEEVLDDDLSDVQRVEIHSHLAIANYHANRPNLAKARHYSELHMASKSPTSDEHAKARLLHAKILLAKGDFEDCETTLAQLEKSAFTSDVLLIKGRLLVRRTDQLLKGATVDDQLAVKKEADANYRSAIETLTNLQEQLGRSDLAVAQYLIAVCTERLDDLGEAERLFNLARTRHIGTPIAIAAGMSEADIQRRQGNDQVAIVSYERVLWEAGDPKTYTNPWLTLRQFRNRIHAAFIDWIGKDKFDFAAQLAKAMWPMIPKIKAIQSLARAHGDAAESLLRKAAILSNGSADSDLDKQQKSSYGLAREKFREMGQTLSELAELRYATREYPDDLWQSATAYFRGQDYANGVLVLQRYLESSPGHRLARAKVMMGEAHLALGNLKQARRALLDCIEFHRLDPDTYRARIIASQVYIEQNEIEPAKSLLLDNLEHPELLLRPDSIEWRDSLFEYGKVVFREAQIFEAASRKKGVNQRDNETAVKNGLQELEKAHTLFHLAIKKLSEALARYSTDGTIADKLLTARYMIAESHRQAAKLPRKLLSQEDIESTRAKLFEQIKQELEPATQTYAALERDIIKLKDQGPLTNVQKTVLRNCYFGRGDTLFEMGDYAAAVRAYLVATSQDQAESLEAFLQIASCKRRLGLYKEAQGVIEQAKVMLARIPESIDFTKTTRYDRQQWKDLLDWLSTF
ncbi:MAG: tetratricopeptide repeat protein [Planctomycetes bacterium]|nr:tetratricopeptide repeat protein [Planctomycetota bacterium]